AAGRAVSRAARAVAEAMPGTVDQDHAPAPRERVAEREALVLEIAAGAVQQYDRRLAALGPDLHHVEPAAGHRNEAAGRTMRAIEDRNGDRRDGGANGENTDKRNSRGEKHSGKPVMAGLPPGRPGRCTGSRNPGLPPFPSASSPCRPDP